MKIIQVDLKVPKVDLGKIITKKFGSQENFGKFVNRDQTGVSRAINGSRPIFADELPIWSMLLDQPIDVIINSIPRKGGTHEIKRLRPKSKGSN